MPKPLEIFWEVGKELCKDKWERGEFVKSPKFPITDTCSLEIYFYPGGMEDSERPIFKRVRSNTEEWMNIKGEIHFCHGDRPVKDYKLDDVFEKGEDFAMYYHLEGISTFSMLKRFHSLPDLGYWLVFNVSTDKDAYTKRSMVLKAEPSDPYSNSVQQTESLEQEAADTVQQT